MNLGFSEMVFLFILALLIFGPKRLPEVGRQIGRFMNEFKRASNELRSTASLRRGSAITVRRPLASTVPRIELSASLLTTSAPGR